VEPDEVERSLLIPAHIAEPAIKVREAQDAHRGDWPSPREFKQPDPPWPHENSPILQYLLWKAKASLEKGMDVRSTLIQLAVEAWFEGGVENYDRGRRDAHGAQ
jgi:hypothetical protein